MKSPESSGAGSKPSQATDKTFLEKIRRFVDRVPNSVKATAKAGAFVFGKMAAEEYKPPLEDVAEHQDIIMEQKADERREARQSIDLQKMMEEKVGKLVAEKKSSISLDFNAGFESLSPKAIEILTTSDIETAQFLSHEDQFPTGDQLGGLAQSKKTTFYLNSKAYDQNLPTTPWLSLTKKIRPDRDLPVLPPQKKG